MLGVGVMKLMYDWYSGLHCYKTQAFIWNTAFISRDVKRSSNFWNLNYIFEFGTVTFDIRFLAYWMCQRLSWLSRDFTAGHCTRLSLDEVAWYACLWGIPFPSPRPHWHALSGFRGSIWSHWDNGVLSLVHTKATIVARNGDRFRRLVTWNGDYSCQKRLL